MEKYEVIIIGAGAAGLMAAAYAAKRGRKVLLIEASCKIGEKIRISGGGKCNFTNLYASSSNYICQNPHFVKSALAGYSQHDFIKLVESYGIAYHEKTLGQLFCDLSSKQIIAMFLDLCKQYQVHIKINCQVIKVDYDGSFTIKTKEDGFFSAQSLIIASGGLSIPKIGASDFGYRIAKQFGLKIIPPRPALVPLIVAEPQRASFNELRGVSNFSQVSYGGTSFFENILFTHQGLSGPAILQISSYLEQFNKQELSINLLPEHKLNELLLHARKQKSTLSNYLRPYLPKRLLENLLNSYASGLANTNIAELSSNQLLGIAGQINDFRVLISSSSGYQKAEVTAGGVDTNELCSKSMASKKISNLFFVGEVVDVTGWLGGYNFQWAWSSGFAVSQYC